MKNKVHFLSRNLIFIFFISLCTFFLFRSIYYKTFKPSLAADTYSAYKPSENYITASYSCGGNSYSFSHTTFDKQWINVIVRINGTITSGVRVYGEKSQSETSDTGTICTGTGSSLQDVSNKTTGAWFRYMDSSGKFSATITYQIPETGKAYSVPMHRASATDTVTNMTVNNSSSTNVFCYKYGDTSNTETGTSCATWDSNTLYAPKDASIGDFTWVIGSDTSSSAPVHQLDVNITPRFNVTYLDYDDTLLAQSIYEYQTPLSTLTVPADLERKSTQQYDYTFSEWSANVNYDSDAVVDDIIYTATYTEILRKYYVTFLDYDDSIIFGPTLYDYGTNASEITPEEPTRPGYAFIGWDSTVSTVTEEKTYKAVYKKLHTITYTDGFGDTIQTTSVIDGENATLPSDPTHLGYVFAGWDKDTTNVTADMTVNATWVLETYKIIIDYDGGSADNISTYTIESDDIIINNPTKEGYEFIGWAGTDISSLTKNLVISTGSTSDKIYKANWQIKQYTLTLSKDDGIESISGVGTYDFQQEVTISAILKEGYNFSGWYENDILISKNINYTFNIPSHDVSYQANSSIKTYEISVNKKKDNLSFYTNTYTVNYKDNQEIIFEKEDKYTIESVEVDGEFIDFLSNKYEFTSIVNNHDIIINYSLDYNEDNIPDKYQKQITYKVVNGIFKDTSTNDDIIINFNTHIYNKGIWQEQSVKLETIPEVIPNEGYLTGSWDTLINEDTVVNDDVTYIYTCIWDYKFIKQPTVKYQIDDKTFEVEWQINFTPVKIEKYNTEDDSFIEELEDPTVGFLTEQLETELVSNYYFKVYYGTNNSEYIISDPIVLRRIILPETGGIGIIVYVTVGLVIILSSFFAFIHYKKK